MKPLILTLRTLATAVILIAGCTTTAEVPPNTPAPLSEMQVSGDDISQGLGPAGQVPQTPEVKKEDQRTEPTTAPKEQPTPATPTPAPPKP